MPSSPLFLGRLTSPRYTGHKPAITLAIALLPTPLGPEIWIVFRVSHLSV